jgi:CRISPR/Cas system CSM-associated protein Csm3 (group 7 of RAMP superfamily)
MLKIKYKINFESPFIIASGVSGVGGFDQVSILSRNLPFIPPSSIRGRVKQAIREHCMENSAWGKYKLCKGQLFGEEGAYCIPEPSKGDHGVCVLCRIFGIPGGEVRKGFDFSGVYLTEAMSELLEKVYEGRPSDALYIRHRRSRRDYLLRRAMEDALFSLGLAKPFPFEASVFETPFHLRYDDETRNFDHAVLLLGLRLVTEIGGGRNRGYGRCRFEIDEPKNWKALILEHINQWKCARKGQ